LRALFDVNLLIALFEPDHIHHEPAQRWWEQNRAGGWASCPLSQNGFVRILSQAIYPRPAPATDLVARLHEAIADTDHEFWPDDISLTDEDMFVRDRILGPKRLTDIYLLALAVRHDGRLATFDRRIPLAAVRGAEPRHLATI
jgi:toxin-antitoxin system PIN domain toxin